MNLVNGKLYSECRWEFYSLFPWTFCNVTEVSSTPYQWHSINTCHLTCNSRFCINVCDILNNVFLLLSNLQNDIIRAIKCQNCQEFSLIKIKGTLNCWFSNITTDHTHTILLSMWISWNCAISKSPTSHWIDTFRLRFNVAFQFAIPSPSQNDVFLSNHWQLVQ